MASDLTHIESTIQVSSNITQGCAECGEREASSVGSDNVSEKVNHYLGHGYQLLHVGSETSGTDEGLWHSTVAVLGKPRAG